MSRFTDQQYLTKDQYRDSSNLDVRIELHTRFSTNPQGWFDWVFDTLVQVHGKASILELGCGSGMMWKECASRIPDGWTVTLTDLSDGMLDAAWRSLVPAGRAFKFEKMDAQSISYDDSSFDVVIANHMLYHVPDRRKALNGIRRVLKDGGCLIATTIGEGHMREMYGWLKQVNMNPRTDMFSNPFTLESGLAQLQEVFLKVEERRYVDDLRVTELQPLVNYIRSSIAVDDMSENELVELEKELAVRLERDGAIFITKDSGLFKAVK